MKNQRLLSTGRVTLALIGLSLGLSAQARTQPPARPGAQGSPAGATTGKVSVVTPSGTLNSNLQFVVTK